MSESFELTAINLSTEKGTAKRSVPEAALDDHGLVGDAHAGAWHRQVSLLGGELIAQFTAETGKAIRPGEFAENFTTRGLDTRQVAPLDRIVIGPVVLEVTQIGKGCHAAHCSVFREVGRCLMPKEGIFCRVITPGHLRVGEQGRHEQRPLRCRIITLSDRAAAGLYADRSGPRLQELLTEFFAGKRWHPQFSALLLPDDADRLRLALAEARRDGVDVLMTTGGTGVGPRDVTPEVVTAACDKLIPGIMEAIRVKYGRENPQALLGRGVAGVAGTMLIYALPGSVRAVEEHLAEILLTLEHLLLMVHGLDVH